MAKWQHTRPVSSIWQAFDFVARCPRQPHACCVIASQGILRPQCGGLRHHHRRSALVFSLEPLFLSALPPRHCGKMTFNTSHDRICANNSTAVYCSRIARTRMHVARVRGRTPLASGSAAMHQTGTKSSAERRDRFTISLNLSRYRAAPIAC